MLDAIINFVFEDYVPNKCNGQKFSLTSDNSPVESWNTVCRKLKTEISDSVVKELSVCQGRIGPTHVGFHSESAGSFEYKDDGLEISSKDNFSTVFSDTCVYKGKWQYEILLITKGVMQIGWATMNSSFSQGNGVGDTHDSYAYDGNRQRKWNSSTRKYGELWSSGDVISSTIDLEKGEITYYRNGRSLGVAFKNVPTGPGIAYFPAFSLAMDESVVVNYGSAPFSYPQHDFQPLQGPPQSKLHVAKMCFKWLDKVVTLSTNWNKFPEFKLFNSSKENQIMCLLSVAEHIGSLLSSALSNPYVVEETVIRIFSRTSSSGSSCYHSHQVLLQFLMAVLQEEERNTFLNTLFLCLQRTYRKTALSFEFSNQNRVLKILHFLLSDSIFRKYCLKNILFQKESNYRMIDFVLINGIDKTSFKNSVSFNYWSSRSGSFESGCRDTFYSKVNDIKVAVEEVRDLQFSVFSLLLTADDAELYSNSSRALFLQKIRKLIGDQAVSSRPSFSSTISASVFYSFFVVCFSLFIRLWKNELEEIPGEKTARPSIFFDGNLDYFEIQRLGGLESHLKKQHSLELRDAIRNSNPNNQMKEDHVLSAVINVTSRGSDQSPSRTVLGEILVSLNEGIQKINVQGGGGLEPPRPPLRTKEELRISLLHLFDGAVLLYHHAGHKHVQKVAVQTDTFFDNVKYYEDLLSKISKYMKEEENYSSPVLQELRNSAGVMEIKLVDQCYQHAWNLATILSIENVKKMLVLLKVTLETLQESSKTGCLFTFVPDFYIETLTQICQDLNCLISCDQNSEKNKDEDFDFYQPGGLKLDKEICEEYFNMLKLVGEFLALHFSDSRIIYADSKDFLIQALAGFVCQRPGLEALESIPLESRKTMILSLLKPYENRAWAQNNWILVRFWKGKGFGFRFTRSPHLSNRLGPKPTHYEIPNVLSYAPYPSDVFLNHISDILKQPEISTPFLNSLLNQLNWVFSEFIGMLQEIQNASNRPERVFIDSRQLRICATCFDLTLALLRVLEMAVSVAPSVFLDSDRQDSKPLLTRLIQILCQVLNRISFSSGCFSHVVNLEIPGLETIHYFPMLTAVIGIICCLLKEDIYNSKEKNFMNPATKGFLEDPSFQMDSLYSFLGGKSAVKSASLVLGSDHSAASVSASDFFTSPECECKSQKFCLRQYPDSVSDNELRLVIDVINHLEKMSQLQQNANVEDNDLLCTICYASSVDAIFVPCGHTSCTSCITQYLMNQTDCFFCMKLIEMVKDNAGKVIYTSSQNINPP